MSKTVIFSVIAIILVGGGAFFGGMKYQQSKLTRFNGNGGRMVFNANGQPRQGGLGQNRQNFRPVNGQITNVDEKSLTVKMADGSSRIVLLSNSTQLLKSQEANREDLKVGETVMAVGTENADGSITAQNIQINPSLRSQSPTVISPTP